MQQCIARKSVKPFSAGQTAPKASRASLRAQRLLVRAENVAVAEQKEKKLSPLQRGGTLSGAAAAGKDAGEKAKQMLEGSAAGTFMQIVDGRFRDDRWTADGRWDLSQFKDSKGEVDWDAVIDVEIARRKLLEATPIACRNEEVVNFDTAEIPWWAWVRRFHLPEAEKLNGRAAMVGYLLAGLVDLATGSGLVDQQESFLGKLLLHVTVFGILLVRSTADLDKYKGLLDEATFYDKQWQASWQGVQRPSETEQ